MSLAGKAGFFEATKAFCLTISSEICFIGKEIAVMSCDVTLWHVMAYDGMWCEGMSCSGN